MSWFNDDKDLSKYEGLFAEKPDRERTSWLTGNAIKEYDQFAGPTKHVEYDFWGNAVKSEDRWF